MNGTITLSADGGEPKTITFGGDLTEECIQASFDAALGSGRVIVRGPPRAPTAPASYAYPSRPPFRQTDKATEDSPRARRYHAPGCRWAPSTRRWTCCDACPVPDMHEEEVADDE